MAKQSSKKKSPRRSYKKRSFGVKSFFWSRKKQKIPLFAPRVLPIRLPYQTVTRHAHQTYGEIFWKNILQKLKSENRTDKLDLRMLEYKTSNGEEHIALWLITETEANESTVNLTDTLKGIYGKSVNIKYVLKVFQEDKFLKQAAGVPPHILDRELNPNQILIVPILVKYPSMLLDHMLTGFYFPGKQVFLIVNTWTLGAEAALKEAAKITFGEDTRVFAFPDDFVQATGSCEFMRKNVYLTFQGEEDGSMYEQGQCIEWSAMLTFIFAMLLKPNMFDGLDLDTSEGINALLTEMTVLYEIVKDFNADTIKGRASLQRLTGVRAGYKKKRFVRSRSKRKS